METAEGPYYDHFEKGTPLNAVIEEHSPERIWALGSDIEIGHDVAAINMGGTSLGRCHQAHHAPCHA